MSGQRDCRIEILETQAQDHTRIKKALQSASDELQQKTAEESKFV